MSAAAAPPSPSGVAQEDSVRAETTIRITADALFDFVADVERLFRLNPHLEIEAWQPLADGLRFAAVNELSGQRLETAVRVEMARADRRIVLHYADGLKRATTLAVERDDERGCRLVVIEHYPVIHDARDPRVAEVDRSLLPWVNAIRRHLLDLRRWNWVPGYAWWSGRFMPGLPPRQRRIVRMIVWVSLLEFIAFLFVAAIFWLQQFDR